MIYTYSGETISFDIIYKKRKSMSISIDPFGKIEVQAPKGTPEERVLQSLEEKWEWIQQRLKETQERARGPMTKVYDHGETFLYLGKTHPIQIIHDVNIQQDFVVLEEDKLKIFVKQLEDD